MGILQGNTRNRDIRKTKSVTSEADWTPSGKVGNPKETSWDGDYFTARNASASIPDESFGRIRPAGPGFPLSWGEVQSTQ
jgi:hypothetical protein